MYNSELEAFKSFISQQQIPVEGKENINQILYMCILSKTMTNWTFRTGDEYHIRFKFNPDRTQQSKFARILTRRKKTTTYYI